MNKYFEEFNEVVAEIESWSKVERDRKLFDLAVSLVVETQRASISNIQRTFRIGFNEAARVMDALESYGHVSPPDNKGARTVLRANS